MKYELLTLEQFINEGRYDKNIFKAIFLAGGPGSGKSFISKTALTGHGLKVVNSDDMFEKLLKDAGLTPSPEDIFTDKGQEIRGRAKNLTAKQLSNYIDGRLGLIIDGTGKNFDKIKKQSETLRELGYDTSMVFVNTSLKVALERNLNRERVLDPKLVEEMWYEVQDNMGKFQNYFGSRNFKIVDNNKMNQNILNSLWKQVKLYLEEPIRNKKAKDWFKQFDK